MFEQFWAGSYILSGHFKNLISSTAPEQKVYGKTMIFEKCMYLATYK